MVIPGFALWSEAERKYVLKFYPPIEITGDEIADTQRIHRHLENVIGTIRTNGFGCTAAGKPARMVNRRFIESLTSFRSPIIFNGRHFYDPAHLKQPGPGAFSDDFA